jgi:hypothetical protein
MRSTCRAIVIDLVIPKPRSGVAAIAALPGPDTTSVFTWQSVGSSVRTVDNLPDAVHTCSCPHVSTPFSARIMSLSPEDGQRRWPSFPAHTLLAIFVELPPKVAKPNRPKLRFSRSFLEGGQKQCS